MELNELTGLQAAELIREGRASSLELVEACLARIAEREPTVEAWAHLDPEYARFQARAADDARKAGRPLGPLHGVPVGVKDIIDTADMPTEYGTPVSAGYRPRDDATVVTLLRRAGAVILGKTVTTELAVYHPGKTRNPHDPARTPGGSSSGSAAAVADRMVPLAVGSQTNGSVIRPAAFCGVVGYKPTHGLISRTGVLPQSRRLDHIGVMARTIADAALIADALTAYDPADPDMRPAAAPQLLAGATGEHPVPPRIALLRTTLWDRADEATREGLAALAELLGKAVEEIDCPVDATAAVERHRTIMEADLALSYAAAEARGGAQLSPRLREMMANGREVRAVDYNAAVQTTERYRAAMSEMFEYYDVALTPAVIGEAPAGLETTGSPIFCTLWTLLGTPAVTLPLLQGEHGLPIGVQLVAAPGDDARLLRAATWLARQVEGGRSRKRKRRGR